MEKQVLSVGQLNDYIKTRLDGDPGLRNIAIRGELSNYISTPLGTTTSPSRTRQAP